MKKTINGFITLFIGVMLLGVIALSFTACDDSGGGNNIPRGGTPRYNTVPYAETPEAKQKGEEFLIEHSAYDDNNNYYVIYLGYIHDVPILFEEAVKWTGVPASGIGVGFERSKATEEMISNSITTAVSETVGKDQEINYGTSFESKTSAKASVGIPGAKAEASWETSFNASIGGSTTWQNSSTRSRDSTATTAITKSTSETRALTVQLTQDDPYGKYRYALFGTSDVYLVLRTSKNNNAIAGYYFAYCARPATYAWGVDYEPDFNGTFEKNSTSKLLKVPSLDDIKEFPIPTSNKLEAIPAPASPTANPAGGGPEEPSAIQVTLNSVNGGDIYYTTNGDNPTTSSTKYTGPITISQSCTLKAIAVVPDQPISEIMTQTYKIKPPRQYGSRDFSFDISKKGGSNVTKVNQNGDWDIYSGGGSGNNVTKVTVEAQLQAIDDYTVNVTIIYDIMEQGGDKTHIRHQQTFTATMQGTPGLKLVDFAGDDVTSYGGRVEASRTGDSCSNNGYKISLPNPNTTPFKEVTFRPDGNGNDDSTTWAKGTVVIKYSYQPVN